MHNDLAQIAKAKGIHRTLALLAILSPKPILNENGKDLQKQKELSDGRK
jgi:hypothetical protein